MYQDQLKFQKRKKFLHRIYLYEGITVCALGLLAYGLFFAGLFDVQTVRVSASDTVSVEKIESAANGWLDARRFFIKHRYNSLLFSPRNLEPLLLSVFPEIE